MVEKIKGISILEQKEYVKAELKAHDKLEKAGYKLSGIDTKTGKYPILKEENPNTNKEKRTWYYFDSWQEAVEILLKKEIGDKDEV